MKSKNEEISLMFLRDQTNLTEKICGIFSVGDLKKTVGLFDIIFQHPTLDKLWYLSTQFVLYNFIFYGY